MRALLLALSLWSPAHADYVSLPASTPQAINQNFKDIEEALAALDVWNTISTNTFILIGQSTVATSTPITGDGSTGSPIDINESLITVGESQVTSLTADLATINASIATKTPLTTLATSTGAIVATWVTTGCGATGDGSTDDTVAIQYCLDNRKHVYFPAGQYRITSQLTINVQGVSLEGDGFQQSQIRKNFNGIGLVVHSSNVVVGQLGFVGVAGNTGDGIQVKGRGFFASEIAVSGMGQDGLRMGCDAATCNSNWWRVEHSSFTRNGRIGFHVNYGGLAVPDVNVATAEGIYSADNSSHGIKIDSSWWVTLISPLAATNTGAGIYLSSNAYSTTIIGGDSNESNTGSCNLIVSTGTINFQHFNHDAGTKFCNYGKSPQIMVNSSVWSVAGGAGAAIVFHSTYPSSGKIFEVWDPTDTGMTRGFLRYGSNTITLGRLSSTGGSSDVVEMTNRTGSTFMHLDTTGGNRSYIGNGGETLLYGIDTDIPQTQLDVRGNFQWGVNVKSTGTRTGDIVMASGSSITLSGPNGFIQGQSSVTTTGGFFGDGSHLTGIFNSFNFKAAARLGTTAALPANSYNNTNGTLTGLSIGALTIDGATANVNDRILVNNEADPARNGIYSVTANSALVVYVLTRTTDFDAAVEMSSGSAVFVTSGTANSSTGWVMDNQVTTLGTDPITFVQFTGLGDVTAGTGLSKSGNTISLITPVSAANLVSTVAYTTVANTFSAAAGNTFTYGVTAGSMSVVNGLTASSGTFTASGTTQYSVQTTSGITVANGGVVAPFFVGNGSALTGLPAAGGGAVLIATQVFSGGNTFLSQSTFSGTLFLSPSLVTGQEIWVGSGTLFNVSFATITLPVVDGASISWRVRYNCNNGTNLANFGFGLNGDFYGASQPYDYASDNLTGSGAVGTGGGDSNEKWVMTGGGNANPLNSNIQGNLYFESPILGGPKDVGFWGNGFQNTSASSRRPTSVGGQYTASSGLNVALTSITFFTSTSNSSSAPTAPATLACHWDLWRQGYTR